MSGCDITGLTFDSQSKLAIEDIRRRKKFFKALKGLSAGELLLLFFRK
jgi:hypothetical protein